MGKRSGVIQLLLACGCALLVGAIVVVAAITYLVFFRKPAQPPAAITDSGQVKALSEQILPGNEPPPGHVGFLGQSTGEFQSAFQGPAGLPKDGGLQPTQMLLAMTSFPAGQATRSMAETALRDTLNGQGYKVWASAGKVLEEQDGVLTTKMGEVRFKRRILDGSPKLQELSMLLENADGKTVVLLADGPADSFNQPALEGYLSRLHARGLGNPLRGAAPPPPAPVPTPEESPAELTPAETPTPAAPPTPKETPAKRKPK